MDNLFDSQEKRETAITGFQSLLSHPGWLLVKKIIEANIEVIRQQLENGTGENESKADVDRLRDKLRSYREIFNTPEILIEKLQETKGKEIVFDPFHTADSLNKLRNPEEEKKE